MLWDDMVGCHIKPAYVDMNTYELVCDVRDHPDVFERRNGGQYGSIDHYFWGTYYVSECGALLWADCYLKADAHRITGSYTVFWNAHLKTWYVGATGIVPAQGGLPRNIWLGSNPPFGHNFTRVPVTFIVPSHLRKLLKPLLKCKTPAKDLAQIILDDIDRFPSDLIWQLENGRCDGSFWD